MSALALAVRGFERVPLPDVVSRGAIRTLCHRTSRALAVVEPGADQRFAEAMAQRPIAVHVGDANAQHYEVPAAFFAHILGPQLKYSCGLYTRPHMTLAEAEEAALCASAAHADLADGQRILELGCGWGSLSLWMARRYPAARITAVSNSASQRRSILERATAEGLGNLEVVTADMNDFAPQGRFDRIVSVEMFEHMASWPKLLARLRSWLVEDGLAFIHVFTHRESAYAFDHTDPTDWIGQHFFTGGIMPSRTLMQVAAAGQFTIDDVWHWSGTHYARTADHWLENFDRHRALIEPILEATYGADWQLWARRWRLFFLATSGLFGFDGGTHWGVSHYRLRPSGSARPAILNLPSASA